MSTCAIRRRLKRRHPDWPKDLIEAAIPKDVPDMQSQFFYFLELKKYYGLEKPAPPKVSNVGGSNGN